MFELISNDNIKELDTVKEFIEFVIKKEKLEDTLFNIIITDNTYIHKLNKEYRGVDRPTDVISFALLDNKDFYESDIKILGDIYISIDKAKEQALEYGHSLLRELCFLSIHGLLHLLGYDHVLKSDEEIMFKKQEELLLEYGIKR